MTKRTANRTRRIPVALLALVLFAVSGVLAAHARDNPIAGVWRAEDGGYIQIYPTKNGWFGRIVGSAGGDNGDVPVRSGDGPNFLGDVILKGLEKQSEQQYTDGTVYNPKTGKKYKASVKMVDPNTLNLRGYVGIALFGKTRTWKRVNPHRRHVKQGLLHKPVAPGPGPR